MIRMTDEQIAGFADEILARDVDLTPEEEGFVHDCYVLLGEATSTGEDADELHARVLAAFRVRHTEANLDGDLHVAGECCGGGSILGRVCNRPGCGGRLHVQPVYSGLMEVCERCDADRDYWSPRGSFLTDGMVGGFGVERSSVFGEIGGADAIFESIARILASGGRAPDIAVAESWLASHVVDPGAQGVRALLLRPRFRAVPASAAATPTVAPRAVVDGPGLWLVSARERDTRGARWWIAIAISAEQAFDRVCGVLLTAPNGERYEDHDTWNARPATSAQVIEVGAGGDVSADDSGHGRPKTDA